MKRALILERKEELMLRDLLLTVMDNEFEDFKEQFLAAGYKYENHSELRDFSFMWMYVTKPELIHHPYYTATRFLHDLDSVESRE